MEASSGKKSKSKTKWLPTDYPKKRKGGRANQLGQARAARAARGQKRKANFDGGESFTAPETSLTTGQDVSHEDGESFTASETSLTTGQDVSHEGGESFTAPDQSVTAAPDTCVAISQIPVSSSEAAKACGESFTAPDTCVTTALDTSMTTAPDTSVTTALDTSVTTAPDTSVTSATDTRVAISQMLVSSVEAADASGGGVLHAMSAAATLHAVASCRPTASSTHALSNITFTTLNPICSISSTACSNPALAKHCSGGRPSVHASRSSASSACSLASSYCNNYATNADSACSGCSNVCKYLEVVSNENGILKVRPAGTKCKPTTYMQVLNVKMSADDVACRSLEERCTRLKKLLDNLCFSNNDSEKIKILGEFVKKHKDLFLKACEQADLGFDSKLTAKDTADLLLLLNITMYKWRSIRTFLRNKNVDIFPSEASIRAEMGVRSSLTCNSSQSIESGVASVKVKSKNKKVAFACVSSLQDRIMSSCRFLYDSGQLDLQKCNNEIWVKIGADKGGNSNKLVFEVCNCSSPNSVLNTELISFYEGPDDVNTTWHFFSRFKEDFNLLQEIDLGNGKVVPVRKFIFGDYHWLCDCFGHQGASATFPCLFCRVPLNVLRNNRGSVHSPMIQVNDTDEFVLNENCNFEGRTLQKISDDYQANLNDHRNGSVLTKNGKYHSSIVRDVLLPVEITHIAPIPLHIALGLGQRFYEQLEETCEFIDIEAGNLQDVDGVGPLVLELHRILEEDLHVQKQAYHSNCFVGNHVAKLVAHPATLTAVLADHPHHQQIFFDLFSKFGEIHKLLGSASFLSDLEIEHFCHLCWEFGKWYPNTFPEETIPPKLHILIFHAPLFMKRWRSVGLFGEHGLESIHHLLNQDFRSYCSVRDSRKRAHLMFVHHNLKMTCDTSALSVKKRKCSCGGWFRFNVKEGCGICQQCNNRYYM